MNPLMTEDKWEALRKALHPDAYAEVEGALRNSWEDPREHEVIAKAVDAHARVTGVHLTIRF